MLSPRKQVPLASGSPSDRPRPRVASESNATTKRAFFCSVVFELSHRGQALPQEVQILIASLGTQLNENGKPVEYDDDDPFAGDASSSTEALLTPALNERRKSGPPKPSSLPNLINELVKTERTYVQRLRVLKYSYADPLRTFARSKDSAIIPLYHANTLFGNIDALVPVHEAFLTDLERMVAPNGHRTVGGIGDVTRKHFKKLKAFDCYKQYYAKREEAQAIYESEMRKSSTGFAGFIDRIQYSTDDAKNRVGLRELLMEPVQRIPRYTMMFDSILKCMEKSDPQRSMLVEAKDAATKIAQAETDDQTTRAAIMIGLERSVQGFPPALISHSRRFIDCIDVDDTGLDPRGVSASLPSVPCTLFLFDDRLMIAKRNSTSTPGRVLAGLDDMERLAKGGILSGSSIKKTMSCKGVLDITDVVAADPGGADIHLYLEREPTDQSERWSNRPFRALSVVHPPANSTQAPVQVAEDKKRFLENLWLAQALYRSKTGRSIPFVADEKDVGSKTRTTVARTYFNVYQRTAYLSEPNKGKVVLHIDPTGTADPLPFGVDSGPYIIVRVRPMRDNLSLYAVSSCDASDEGEEDYVPTATVSTRIVQTIHQCGLFRFQSGRNSRPTTPTASTRGRGAIFNLDAISRNLFTSSKSGHSRGISGADFFGASVSGSGSNGSSSRKRSRSNSRGSTLVSHSTGTTTSGTNDSSTRFFSQRSVSTAATSVMDGGDSFGHSHKSSSSPMKFFQRGRSPEQGGSPSKSAEFASMSYDSLSRSTSAVVSHGRDKSRERPTSMVTDESSEVDLRLELARHNSLISQQHSGSSGAPARAAQAYVDETIPEDSEDSSTIRHAPSVLDHRPPSPSIASHQSHLVRPPSPNDGLRPQSPGIPSRPSSAMSNHSRRPMGPRDLERSSTIKASDIEATLERTLSQLGQSRPRTPSPPRQSSPRKRVPVPVAADPDLSMIEASPMTPDPPREDVPRPVVEPLSIVKKTSVRSSAPPPRREKEKGKERPASVQPGRQQRGETSHAGSSSTRTHHTALGKHPAARATSLAEETWEDIERTQRSVKRIRLEVDDMSATSHRRDGSASPTKRPLSRNMGSAADARMEEMRQMIEKGRGALPPPRSASPLLFNPSPEAMSDHLRQLVVEAERDLKHATQSHQALQAELKLLSAEALDKDAELVRANNELQHAKRQCELVKKLLADATAENEIMYDAFNEELDGMFKDANLPETEAWSAMVEDLRKAKDDRNALTKENKSLKQSLELAQLQNEEWGALLRSHGLIP